MSLTRSDIADKNIVDKRDSRRHSDIAKAIRKTREKLADKAGTGSFDRTLLKMHARAIIASATAMPVLIGLIAAGGFVLGIGIEMLAWAALAILLYGGVLLVARRAEALDEREINVPSLTRRFLIANFVAGLGWAVFALLECQSCGAQQVTTIKAVVLLLAMAATAITGSSLKHGLTASFVVPVAIYVFFASSDFEPIGITMAVTLVAALPFFSFVSGQLHASTVMLLSFRTEKDALIAELETANAMSDEARHRAEEANLAKSRFLASMSHELRTPLNAILGFSEVMTNEVLGPIGNKTYREYAGDIHTSGQHLLELINEILDLSRIEAGRYQLNEGNVSLSEVLAECCHMMELKTRNRDIRIVRHVEPEMPDIIADERSVRQVVLNILSNAVKFTPTGGEITVKVGWTSGGGQYISIKDNGPGIPAEEIPIVLSAFGQGSIAIKSAEQGAGLGLPIVQAIMKMHGGRLDLASKLRRGTVATALFPASRVLSERREADADNENAPVSEDAATV